MGGAFDGAENPTEDGLFRRWNAQLAAQDQMQQLLAGLRTTFRLCRL